MRLHFISQSSESAPAPVLHSALIPGGQAVPFPWPFSHARGNRFHFYVISGLDFFVMFSSCPPVGCNHALEAPLAAENIFQKLAILRSAVTIDCIVGGHDGPWLCLFYNDLETFQIDLTKCTLGNTGIAVLLLVSLLFAAKCFTEAAMCWDWIPFTIAAPIFPAISGSSE